MTTNAADQHQRPTKRNSALRGVARWSASRRTSSQFVGTVLDHTGKALAGVRLSIGRTALVATSDANGNFEFAEQVPPDKLDLFVDGRAVTGTAPLPPGSTQTSTPTQYPALHFEVLAIRGQRNLLPHPIYLPPILMSEARIVGGNTDVILRIPGREGFEMVVKAGSVTFPDGSKVGPLVVSPVADDRLPMSPPGGMSSFMRGTAATLQPAGTRFDPPIEVRLPNTAGYKPGERVPVYHWDHDLAQFVAIGQATVTEDGAQLITDPGSGITKAGWSGPPVPPPCVDTGVKGPCPDCQNAETVGGQCRVRVCVKDPQSTSACDDKDECTANDKCSGGQCKGEPIRVNITADSATICVGRSKVFAAQSTPTGRTINWAASGGASVDAAGVVTSVSVGAATITASDATCEKASASTAARVMDKASSATGESEFDACTALGVAGAAACAVALSYQYRIDPPTDAPYGTWISTNFKSIRNPGDCRANREGSEMDAATHAYLSCQLHTDPTTRTYAKQILDAHENAATTDSCESHEMDYNNNEIGRQLATEPGDCSAKAFAALNGGRLQVNQPFQTGICAWRGRGL